MTRLSNDTCFESAMPFLHGRHCIIGNFRHCLRLSCGRNWTSTDFFFLSLNIWNSLRRWPVRNLRQHCSRHSSSAGTCSWFDSLRLLRHTSARCPSFTKLLSVLSAHTVVHRDSIYEIADRTKLCLEATGSISKSRMIWAGRLSIFRMWCMFEDFYIVNALIISIYVFSLEVLQITRSVAHFELRREQVDLESDLSVELNCILKNG